jgi:hypothetical protein
MTAQALLMRRQHVALLFTDELSVVTDDGRVTDSTVQPAPTRVWLRPRGRA